MSDRGSSCSTSLEEDPDSEGGGGGGGPETERGGGSPAPSLLGLSSSLRAVVRIKQKYQALKRRRQEMAFGGGGLGLGGGVLGGGGVGGALSGAPPRSSPKIFTFEGLGPNGCSPPPGPQKKKRRRRRRVMFPTGGGRRAPPKQGHSRATYCLYLLLAIVFVQVYNAIENLDDHVLRYDLEGLEKTLRREVFGQPAAVDALLTHLRDYLSTYVHNRPLLLSVHGPGGVGKSHLGRLLAAHFRSVVGDALVLQYFSLHRCPLEAEARRCAANLTALVSKTVRLAEEEEKIPLFVLDEAEHAHAEVLDALLKLVAAERSNEHLNAVYLLLSNLGHAHITRHLLHNASSAGGGGALGEVEPLVRGELNRLHPLWAEAELLLLGLLERRHVADCFLDEVSREGFYPDRAHVERLAAEVEYYPEAGGRRYSKTGCKQVVAKVNLL